LTAINVIHRAVRTKPLQRKKKVFDHVPVQTEIDPEFAELQFRVAGEKRSF